MEWMEIGCVRRLLWQPERNLRRQTQQDRSWGKSRGCLMLERRGQVEDYGVCSFSYTSWCSTFLCSSLSIRKIACLVQLLTKSIKLAVKGKREPACCGISGTELLFSVRSQPSLRIYCKELILGKRSQVKAVAVRAWNTWWFWVAWCSMSLAVAYRELSATELEEQRRKSLVAAGQRSCRTLQVCCREAQQKFLCSERLMLFNLI